MERSEHERGDRDEEREGASRADPRGDRPGREGPLGRGPGAALADAKAARVRAAVKAGKLSEAAGQAQLTTIAERARAEVRRHRPIVGLGGALVDALVAARSARITAAVRLGALSGAEGVELWATLRRRMSALAQRGSARSH